MELTKAQEDINEEIIAYKNKANRKFRIIILTMAILYGGLGITFFTIDTIKGTHYNSMFFIDSALFSISLPMVFIFRFQCNYSKKIREIKNNAGKQ